MRLLSEADVERLIDPPMAIASAAEAYRLHSAGAVPAPGRLDLSARRPERKRARARRPFAWPAVRAQGQCSCLSRRRIRAPQCSEPAHTVGFRGLRAARPHRDDRRSTITAPRRVSPRPRRSSRHPMPQRLRCSVPARSRPRPSAISLSVRPFRQVLIVGRGRERATALAAAARHWPGLAAIKVDAEPDPARAAQVADVILTITTADAPVFPGAAVEAGRPHHPRRCQPRPRARGRRRADGAGARVAPIISTAAWSAPAT